MESPLTSFIRAELVKTAQTISRIERDPTLVGELERIARRCLDALRSGGKILFAGNGGSAADAQHLAAELVSRFAFDRPGVSGIALTTDTSVLSAIGNDYGFDRIFARQVEAIGRAGDVFIGISTSGKSQNILTALAAARQRGMITVGFTGSTGGDMPMLCDYCVRVPSTETPKIQEAHITLGHIVCGLIERDMFGGTA